MADWKTYTNTKYGFEFKFPPELKGNTGGDQFMGSVYGNSVNLFVTVVDKNSALVPNMSSRFIIIAGVNSVEYYSKDSKVIYIPLNQNSSKQIKIYAELPYANIDRILPTFKFTATTAPDNSGPTGILLPSNCKIVGSIGDAEHPYTQDSFFGEGTWLIDCGSKNNSNARATIGPVLVQQGWKFCDSGLAGATWWKDGIITGVFEGSGPAGYFGLSQNDFPSCQ